MKLEGFYNPEVLSELLYKEQITWLEAIYHHSQERIDEYKDFCKNKNLQEDEKSAQLFFDYLLEVEDNAMAMETNSYLLENN